MIPAIAKAGNPLIIINHTRVAGTTFTGAKIYTEPCGYALNYYPTIKVRFATRKFTKDDKLDISASQAEDADGFCVTFSVTKNRLGPLNRSGAKLVFRYATGLDTLTDLIEIITTYEIAKKLSTVTWQLVKPGTDEAYIGDDGKELTFAGKGKMIDYLRNNTAFRTEYEKAVSDYINKAGKDISLIDEDDLAEITAMEKGVEKSIKNENEPIEESAEQPETDGTSED